MMMSMPRALRTTITCLALIACAGAPAIGQPSGENRGGPVRDHQLRLHRHVTSWWELRRQNIVVQKRDYSCGAAALATLIRYYWGDEVTEDLFLRELDKMLTREEALDRIKNGLSLTDLRRVAVRTGYQATMGKLKYEKLAESRVPLIIGITVRDYDHFVVYRGSDDQYVYLADPIRGNIRTPIWEFVGQWQKNAVLAVAKRNTKLKDLTPLTVSQSEMAVGELNAPLVRKNFMPPRIPFPMSARP